MNGSYKKPTATIMPNEKLSESFPPGQELNFPSNSLLLLAPTPSTLPTSHVPIITFAQHCIILANVGKQKIKKDIQTEKGRHKMV